MIPKFLIDRIGASAARLLTVFLAVMLVCLVVGIAARSCVPDPGPQARQDVKSSDAVAVAARDAVATVVASADREKSVDAVVSQAVKEIDNAPNPAVARSAVVNAVCGMRAYRDRPECTMQRVDPEDVARGR